MEALEITDVLNENVLRYRLKGGASYIRDKRIKTFYPSSVSTYSSNSNSVIRFNLTGGANEWINHDKSTKSFDRFYPHQCRQ